MPSPQACCEVAPDAVGKPVVPQPSGVAGVHGALISSLAAPLNSSTSACILNHNGGNDFNGNSSEKHPIQTDEDRTDLSRQSHYLTKYAAKNIDETGTRCLKCHGWHDYWFDEWGSLHASTRGAGGT